MNDLQVVVKHHDEHYAVMQYNFAGSRLYNILACPIFYMYIYVLLSLYNF